jgi:ribokinase
MVEIFTAGGIIVDNVVAADGTVHLETMGGNAVYSAAGARLWRERVGIVGVVPENYPRHWLDRLRRAGIDTRGVTVLPERVETSEWFFYRPDGSRTDQLHAEPGAFEAFGLAEPRIGRDEARRFEEHLRARPKPGRSYAEFRGDHPVTPAHVPAAFWRAAGIHLGPNRQDAQAALARRARRAGAQVSLDPGAHAEALARDGLPALLSAVDVFLPSEKEIAALVPAADLETALRRLAALGPRIVAAKLGPAGSVVCTAPAGPLTRIPVVPVPAVDPTGAGDAYAGGFLAGWLAAGDPLIAACLGTVSASFAVEDFGPFRLLEARRAEARARLERLVALVPAVDAAALLPPLEPMRPER